MADKCFHRGAMHIQRSADRGQIVRIGEQKCPYCGAQIIVVQKPAGWAFVPSHDVPSKPPTTPNPVDK